MSTSVRSDTVKVEAFDVACRICGTSALVETGSLEDFALSHRQPVVTTIYARLNGGPLTVWRCRQPRPLR